MSKTAHGKTALRFRFTPDAAASTATRPSFVTMANAPLSGTGWRECSSVSRRCQEKLLQIGILLLLVASRWSGCISSVNEVFERDFRALATTTPFKVGVDNFTLTGFRLSTPRVSRNKLVYAANQRGVVSDKLEDFIPNLSGRIHQPDGSSFVYLGIVQGAYLTQRVNAARTDFDFGAEDAEDELPLFGNEDIKRADIRNECVRLIQQELAEPMKTINDIKEERVQAYVQAEAPQYKILMKYSREFIGKIPPEASKPEIEAALHHELYQREAKMRQESGRIIKEAEKISDYDEYKRRFAEFMEDYNEIGASALAQYVAHRRIILDFLERAISRAEGADK
jgi:hypothetical protein